MKRRKTKKVKMVRILGETVRKGGVRYRYLLAERRHFLRRQRDPESSYYGVPISELLKSNRRRGLRRNEGEGKIESEGKRRLRERLQKPSTSFEYIVQGYYPGSGWEDLTTADNYWEALQDKKAYEENERQYAHRLIKRRIKKISANRRRGLRRNEEYARQIPRRDRSMRGRGFDKRFDVSAGSEYKDLQNFLATGRPAGMKSERKIGANTLVRRYNDGSIGVILYSTRILHYHPNGEVDVNFGGYMTPTTFSRINALIPYGWNLRKKGGKLALENSWGQRAVIRKPRAGEEYAVRLTSDKAYLID
jgi:hypothetical protein